MQEASHILEDGFEIAILLAGFVYLCTWMAGNKLTNRQILSVFAIGFVGSLLLNLFSPSSTYVVFIAMTAPSAIRLLKRKLSLKPKPPSNQIDASSKKSDAVRIDSLA